MASSAESGALLPMPEERPSSGERTVHYLDYRVGDYVDLRGNFQEGCPRTQVESTWQAFGARLSTFKIIDPKDRDPKLLKKFAGAWSGGLFGPGLGWKNLQMTWVGTNILALDVDKGDVHKVAATLERWDGVFHTTYTHTTEAPRCRGVLLLDRRVTIPTEYYRLRDVVAGALTKAGFTVDVGASRISGFMYWPCAPKGSTPIFLKTCGEPLKVDAVLSKLPPATPAREAGPSLTPCRQHVQKTDHDPWYRAKAFDSAARNILSVGKGARHETLWNEMLKLHTGSVAATESELRDGVRTSSGRHSIRAAWDQATAGECRDREFDKMVGDILEAGEGRR